FFDYQIRCRDARSGHERDERDVHNVHQRQNREGQGGGSKWLPLAGGSTVPSAERRAALPGASAHSGAQTGEVQALAARLTASMSRWFDCEPTHSGGDKPKLPTSTFVLPCGGENTNVSGEKTGLDFHLNTLVWTVSP